MKRFWYLFLVIALASGMVFFTACSDDDDDGGGQSTIEKNFETSLHKTIAGMEWFYNQPKGFGAVSGVDYETAGCGNCHSELSEVNPCFSCHTDGVETTPKPDNDKCFVCHSRQSTTFSASSPVQEEDVHIQGNDFECSRCHGSGDLHGDGTAYTSMLQPGAIDTKCEDCHGQSVIDAHSSTLQNHMDKMECQVCHTQTVISCYNCHFETLLNDGVKKAYKPISDFVFLMNNDEGKLTTASFQSVSYQDKNFVVFAPYYAHTIGTKEEARSCSDCHDSAAIDQLNDEGKITFSKWEGGELVNMTGVIPLVDFDKLEMQFLEWDGAAWSPKEGGITDSQIEFGSALTEDQLESLGYIPPTEIEQNFETSLHKNITGMEWFYNQPDGFGAVSGVDFATSGCGNCHSELSEVNPCYSCHTDGVDVTPSPGNDKCFVCHSRQSTTFADTGAVQEEDYHIHTLNYDCSDCHKSGDLHGDGTAYNSMLEDGAIDVECDDCHGLSTVEAHSTTIQSHMDNLECQACHTQSVISCYNCHFESLLNDGIKRAYKPLSDFVFLMNNDEGKVTTASFQSVSYGDKNFYVFAPYYAHTIGTKEEARSCSDCHNNEAISELNSEGKITFTKWEEGALVHKTGVIPLVDFDKLEMQFLEYDGAAWAPKAGGTVSTQIEFGTALTEDQLEALGYNP